VDCTFTVFAPQSTSHESRTNAPKIEFHGNPWKEPLEIRERAL
jgi:hypothetical protein